jgi:hypothetical protein
MEECRDMVASIKLAQQFQVVLFRLFRCVVALFKTRVVDRKMVIYHLRPSTTITIDLDWTGRLAAISLLGIERFILTVAVIRRVVVRFRVVPSRLSGESNSWQSESCMSEVYRGEVRLWQAQDT